MTQLSILVRTPNPTYKTEIAQEHFDGNAMLTHSFCIWHSHCPCFDYSVSSCCISAASYRSKFSRELLCLILFLPFARCSPFFTCYAFFLFLSLPLRPRLFARPLRGHPSSRQTNRPAAPARGPPSSLVSPLGVPSVHGLRVGDCESKNYGSCRKSSNSVCIYIGGG